MIKEISEFSPTSVYKGETQYRSDCKKCNAENARRRRDNPEERKRQVLAARAWKRRNPEKVAIQCRKRMYGLSDESFKLIIEAQKGLCGICSTQLSGTHRGNSPYVDHDHNTGKVRGILCRSCNFGLGLFSDNFSRLIKAADYIRRTS